MKNEKSASVYKAFTLVELLIVIGIIALLISIALPCLAAAGEQCSAVVCRSNIRQLHIANTGYALSNNDYYVRAAPDIDSGYGGRERWHGVRLSDTPSADPDLNTFDPTKSPLNDYINDGKVKECPAKVKYTKEGIDAFEAGCGGYGYNSTGVGSRTYQYGFCNKAMQTSMKLTDIRQSADKIMFTDTAFNDNGQLIEYSFCEPPMFVLHTGKKIKEYPGVTPSIHFRHRGKTNVVWCDGHVSAEELDFPPEAFDQTDEFKIGWFGPENNSLFKPWN
ncbi:MAG: prepilin-type N-terminal cleavage/methylation domain-containing protein [Phycisphaerae bacterium]|jgi:prepilin-type processing-associated H-X9-DG protein/prepilin-type N-terminal cleavage/methylation domain-containing protein